jgi:Tol biopolymer transport system component
MKVRAFGVFLLILAMPLAAAAAGSSHDALPLTPARQLHLQVSQGTWMSLDLSPDRRTIVFDLLGDIYVLPAGGGEARAITRGLPFDTQPVFSPDGKWIAFVSDRSGSDNLWIMRANGTGLHQLTLEDDDTVFASPAWREDGKALFVSHYLPSLNHYELWLQPVDGKATIVAPIKETASSPREAWQSTLGAAPTGDGTALYFARRTGTLSHDDAEPWQIVRRDLRTDKETIVLGGPVARGMPTSTFFRPQPSPDGTKLAYGTRRAGRTELRIRDLRTGLDHRIAEVDPDQLQAAAWQDILPRYVFTPDGSALLVSRHGGFERLALDDSRAAKVPFHADVRLAVGPSTRRRIRESGGPVRARLIQAPVSSPDNANIAFSALGRIFVQARRATEPPRPISGPGAAAFQPSWSPDGNRIAYVTWTEADGGWIWIAPRDGSSSPVPLTVDSAYYSYPVFTPDGRSLIAVRSPTAARRQATFEFGKVRQAELVLLPLNGGPERVLTTGRLGGRPHFSADGKLVYILTPTGLASVDLASGALHIIVQVKGPGYYFLEGSVAVDDMRLSPDGKWLLAQVAQQLHLVPMPVGGVKEVDLTSPSSTARQLTDVGADYFEWRPDGAIEWSVGAKYVQTGPPGATGATGPRSETDISIVLPSAPNAGTLLLRHGRVLTMAGGDRILPDADILIEDGRIARLGASGSLFARAGASVIDLGGKTVIPGLIDVHDHIGGIRRDVLSLEDWGLRVRLAYGITTSFDPSTLSIDMLVYQDLIDAGLMVGPRLRSTGPALFSFNRFRSLDQVRAVLRRYREAYRLDNLKEYRTGSRRVREWVAIAAREQALMPTTEGALALKLDLSQIIDGFAGNEHVLPAPLERDVIGLLAAMRTSYTTTLMTTNSGPPGADWFVAQRDPQQDPKIRRFWPPSAIQQRLTNRPWISLSLQRFPLAAAGAAAVARAGGLVGMGAHGEVPGIGFHWEMAAHVMGGMTPMEVLHAATAGSAETIGRLDDLGTVEPGKIADLVILDADPLQNIDNTQRIASIVQSGRLYDGNTLDQIWPTVRPLEPAWFASAGDEQWLPANRADSRR